MKKTFYMVTITILKLYVIHMLIRQDLHLIEDPFPDIVFLLVIILIFWKSKKHVMTRSSGETKYRVMASATYEII